MIQDLVQLILIAARYEQGLPPVGQRDADSCWPEHERDYPQEMRITFGNELLYDWMDRELNKLPLRNKKVIVAYLWSGEEVDTKVASKILSTSPCHLYKVYQESLEMLYKSMDKQKFLYWKNVLI